MDMMNITSPAANGSSVSATAPNGVQADKDNEGTGDFASALVQLLGDKHVTGESATAGSTEDIPSLLLKTMNSGSGELTQLLSDEGTELGDLEELAAKLLKLLEGLSEEEKQKAETDPAFMDWMAEANALLLTLIPAATAESSENARTGQASSAISEDQLIQLLTNGSTPENTLAHLMQSIKKLQQHDQVNSQQIAAFQEVLTKLQKMLSDPSALQAGSAQGAFHAVEAASGSGIEAGKGNSNRATRTVRDIGGTAGNQNIVMDSAPVKTVPLIQPVGLKHLQVQQTAAAVQQMQQSAFSAADEVMTEQTPLGIAETQLPAETAEPFTVVQLPETAKTVPAEVAAKPVQLTMSSQQFVDDMSQFLFKHVKVTQFNGLTEAQITLTPEHLGQVEVKLSLQNGHLVAQFMASSNAGKEMLENQLHQLRHTLLAQGIQVEKLEVTQNTNAQTSMFQDQRQQQFKEQSGRQGNRSRTSAVDTVGSEFADDLNLEEEARLRNYGSEFNVTA
ncbi:flagellar hook-length control protein FliK [Paenibacillus gansuensis]|uniref:Flagellar hook-length control protein FliK n=1 Tax=Paenibacillus gansuensis TaxID=306542 RepID=A0ABW5PDL1_9BACL